MLAVYRAVFYGFHLGAMPIPFDSFPFQQALTLEEAASKVHTSPSSPTYPYLSA